MAVAPVVGLVEPAAHVARVAADASPWASCCMLKGMGWTGRRRAWTCIYGMGGWVSGHEQVRPDARDQNRPASDNLMMRMGRWFTSEWLVDTRLAGA